VALETRLDDAKLHLSLARRGPTDELLPDHDHLMHLFMVRLPDFDRIEHLHPEVTTDGGFVQKLPPLPAGRYALFADVVHASGLPETAVGTLALDRPEGGTPLLGDDAEGTAPSFDPTRIRCPLEEGAELVWLRPAGPQKTRTPTWFRFRAERKGGEPAADLEPYMGMLGHAAFIRRDLSVFAHVHPSGSVPMASLALSGVDPHAAHRAMRREAQSEVAFPYGLPQPGDYRLFVQIKRLGKVATCAFDVHAVD
jgi:hypothetical protein